jgi:PIN domain nuclease of toxin-antitoxin system
MAPAAVPLLPGAAAGARLFVCDISYWEVGAKAAKGKLVLSMDAPFWLRRAERAPGVIGIPLDREILTLSTRLPGKMHGDPADRMLIAAAQLHSAALVTADAAIIEYASGQRGIPVCDARL